MDSKPDFTYWKHPWQKWLLLLAAGLVLIGLVQLLSDFRELTAVGDRIFSPDLLARTLAAAKMRLLLNGLLLIACVWSLLTGLLAHRKQSARFSELVLALVLTAVYGIGLKSSWTLLPDRWFWSLVLAILAALTLCQAVVWSRSRKQTPSA